MFLQFLKDIDARPETQKILEEKVGCTFEGGGIGKGYFKSNSASHSANKIRSTIDKWDIMKSKSFCISRRTVE